MASTIILKRRIRSIKNTRQITKAMQLVSASKLRRAQEYALQSRAYADLANELLTRLSGISEVENQPLFVQRSVQKRLYVVITSNSGLAGAYNANVLKQLTKGLQADRDGRAMIEDRKIDTSLEIKHTRSIQSKVIVVGTRGAQFVRRLAGVELLAAYPALGDHPTANDVRPLLNTIIEEYKSGAVDDVRILYTKFKSTVSQEARSRQLLPAQTMTDATVENDGVDQDGATSSPVSAISNFEPDVETVIDQVGTRLIEAQIWQSILESLASEHAMRMVAMKNATDNAKELIDDYTLALNTARQSAITQELAEITGGAEALK